MVAATRRTKIVATIGPVSSTPEMVGALAEAGMDAARLNFSHGTHEDHAERVRVVRAVERELGRPLALIADLQGPKLRIGRLEQARVLEMMYFEGKTQTTIAEELGLSERTVKTYVSNLLQKLHLSRRAEAAASSRAWTRQPGRRPSLLSPLLCSTLAV